MQKRKYVKKEENIMIDKDNKLNTD